MLFIICTTCYSLSAHNRAFLPCLPSSATASPPLTYYVWKEACCAWSPCQAIQTHACRGEQYILMQTHTHVWKKEAYCALSPCQAIQAHAYRGEQYISMQTYTHACFLFSTKWVRRRISFALSDPFPPPNTHPYKHTYTQRWALASMRMPVCHLLLSCALHLATTSIRSCTVILLQCVTFF